MDLSLCTALVFASRAENIGENGRTRQRRCRIGSIGLAFAVGVGTAGWANSYSQPVLSTIGSAPTDGSVIAITAENLVVGTRFPLYSRMRGLANTRSEALDFVVMYRNDCSDCLEAVPKYDRLASLLDRKGGGTITLIEVPPLAKRGGQFRVGVGLSCVRRGHLDVAQRWFVETPLLVIVRDGVIVRVISRSDGVDITGYVRSGRIR